MNSRSVVAALTILLVVAAPRVGALQNGIVEFEIPYSETDYVLCLGEDVEFNMTVTVRTHLVEGPGGAVHYVENWFLEGVATGLDSGLTWYGHAVSPYGVNATGAQLKDGWNVEAIYEPLDGGQKFRKSQRLRFVHDANGVVRVERFEPYQFNCLGP